MWLDGFPIAENLVPKRLKDLVAEIPNQDPNRHIVVVTHLEIDPHGPDREELVMQTSVVPDEAVDDLAVLRRKSDFSHVSSSLTLEKFGSARNFTPSIGGHDYLVASWGSNSFFNYNLSEKVWMGLGLSARTIGGDHQSLVFDDLGLPEMGIAKGEASSKYHWESSRPVTWTIRNDYLRRYLWMRGAHGVRIFYYSKRIPVTAEWVALLNGSDHFGHEADDGRYELAILAEDASILL